MKKRGGSNLCSKCGRFGKRWRENRRFCTRCHNRLDMLYKSEKARKGVVNYAELFALFDKYD